MCSSKLTASLKSGVRGRSIVDQESANSTMATTDFINKVLLKCYHMCLCRHLLSMGAYAL